MTELYPIHEVLALLRPGHPNLNVSKIRFLEGEGAIHPVRRDDGRLYYSPAEISAALPSPNW